MALITPNLPEAAALLDAPHAQNEREMKEQGNALLAMGCRAVLMKGGHLDDAESPDWLFTHDGAQRFTAPRVRTKTPTARAVRSRRRWRRCVPETRTGRIRYRRRRSGSRTRWQKPILWKWVTVLGRFTIFMHGGKPYTGIKPYARENTEMEQAHTRLIAQLKERIAAPDNTPLYLKFAETVKNAVRSGVLAHGNILPGERDLSQLAGVSRITVRKAMQALEEAGVVTRARGYGTQINNIFEYSLKEARGFSQQVVLRGKTPNTLWVNKRVVKCPEEIARHLSLAPDSDVFLLKRIRYVDDDAVSIEESRVPVGLIPNPDDIGVSLYDYFRSQNIFPQRTRSRVSARMPDSEFQAHIKMDDKIPVLVIKQVALDQQHRPIEYSISYCRSDLYVFVCEE